MIKTNDLSKRSQKSRQLKKFTFVGGTSKSDRIYSAGESKLLAFPNSILLSEAQINDWVTISEIYTEQDIQGYLRQLGFKPKTKVKIVSHSNNGSTIVSIGEHQIGLGSEITRQIIVTLASERE